MADSTQIKSLSTSNSTPESKYQRWKEEVVMSEKESEKFRTQGRKVVRRFKDERDAAESGDKKFNIFAANVGILQSSLYAKIPKVDIKRRFNQQMDDVARVASILLHNVVMQDMEDNDCYFDQVMREAVEDRLVPGMGTAWLRLEVETEEEKLEEQKDPVTNEVIQEAATFEKIKLQEVVIEHVHWEDFLYSPCRTWAERRWVGRRVYMDQDALVKRFGGEVGKAIPLDYNPKKHEAENTPINEVLQKACIYELWDRATRAVIWISKGYPKILDEKPDPLKLENFEPCPRPLFATTTTSNCIPISDFVMIQDQYDELDTVNNRISLLVRACKVVGVYDSGAVGVQRMLQEGSDNTLIPVDNWAMFAEKGGIKGSVDWLPLDQVVAALERLRTAREDIKGQIYELTGIADIVRGNTKASETLGAQQIKAQFASVRIQKLQDEVARFAQDILRIKAEIVCRHFDERQISEQSNAKYYPDFAANPQLVAQAIALLTGAFSKFQWRVKVQADSLAQTDYQMQKQERVEMVNSVATFLQSASTTMKAVPDSAPIVFETLKFAMAGFKGAQELEGVIDSTLNTVMKKIKEAQNQPPPPDPAIEKAKMEIKLAQDKAELDHQAKQQEMGLKSKQAQDDFAREQQEHAAKMEQMEREFKLKMWQAEQEFSLKMQQERANLEMVAQKANIDFAIAEQKGQQQAEQMERKNELDEQRHKESIAAITKPRKVVRDKNGKVEGAE